MQVGMSSVWKGITPAKSKLPPSSPMARDQHRDTPAAMSLTERGTKIVLNTWKRFAPRERAVRFMPVSLISLKRLAVNETTNGEEMKNFAITRAAKVKARLL